MKWNEKREKLDGLVCVYVCVCFSIGSVCVCVCPHVCTSKPLLDSALSPHRYASVLTCRWWPASLCDTSKREIEFAVTLPAQEVMARVLEPFLMCRNSRYWRLGSLMVAQAQELWLFTGSVTWDSFPYLLVRDKMGQMSNLFSFPL